MVGVGAHVGELLKKARRGRGLKQQELADNAGLSSSLVSQLERGKVRTSREALRKLADALDWDEREFGAADDADRGFGAGDDTHRRLARRDLLKAATGVVAGGLTSRRSPVEQPCPPPDHAPGGDRADTEPAPPLERAKRAPWFGDWQGGIDAAEEALAACPRGSEGWIDIKLRHLAYLEHEAGNITAADRHISEGETQLRGLVDAGPTLPALVYSRRGDIQLLQRGLFDAAATNFREASQLLRDPATADRQLREHAAYACFKSVTEAAMAASGTWLWAGPSQARSPTAEASHDALAQALADTNPALFDRDSGNPNVPYNYYTRFTAKAVLGQPDAQNELLKNERVFEDIAYCGRDTSELFRLGRARLSLSNAEYGDAIRDAQVARERYSDFLKFPHGIALAAAIEAAALSRRGWCSEDEWQRCLDLSVLALLLHPYPTHPLWKATQRVLKSSLHGVKDRYPRLWEAYFPELDERIEDARSTKGKTVFQVLGKLYTATYFPAEPYVKLVLLTPAETSKDLDDIGRYKLG